MRKVEIILGADKVLHGLFHGFFQVGNLEHGCDPIAVVEMEDGRCTEFATSYIRFENQPAKEQVEG